MLTDLPEFSHPRGKDRQFPSYEPENNYISPTTLRCLKGCALRARNTCLSLPTLSLVRPSFDCGRSCAAAPCPKRARMGIGTPCALAPCQRRLCSSSPHRPPGCSEDRAGTARFTRCVGGGFPCLHWLGRERQGGARAAGRGTPSCRRALSPPPHDASRGRRGATRAFLGARCTPRGGGGAGVEARGRFYAGVRLPGGVPH